MTMRRTWKGRYAMVLAAALAWVGASTVIDLLNTEQTLLNTRVNLVKASQGPS